MFTYNEGKYQWLIEYLEKQAKYNSGKKAECLVYLNNVHCKD